MAETHEWRLRLTSYLVVEGSITDQVKWAEYREAVLPLITRHGGKHITEGGRAELVEGSHAGRIIALFAFPSVEAARRFWQSPSYIALKEIRRDAANLHIWIVPGTA